jgi:O-antigen ligase
MPAPHSASTLRLPAPDPRAATILVRPSRPAVAVDATWDLLMVFVGLYILTAVGRVHQLFPVFEAIRPALLVGAAAILLFVLDQHRYRRLQATWLTPTRFLAGLFIWMVLSTPTALVLGNSFDIVVNNFSKTFLMFFVVAGTVRRVRDVERLVMMYLLGAVIYAMVVITRFDVGMGTDWRLSNLYYYDANDFATFVVTSIPFGLHFAMGGRNWLWRLGGVVALAILTVAFVYTGSRGGFIALAALVVFIVLRYSAIRLSHRLGATAMVTVVVLLVASDQYWTQMTTILENDDYNRTESSGRLQIWTRGLGYIAAYPVFGLGPNNFETAEGTFSPQAERSPLGWGVEWNAAHNSYLQIAAEIGLPGLFFFVGMIVSTMAMLHRQTRRQAAARGRARARPELSQALTGSLIGFSVGAFFLSLAYHEMLYMLVAFAVGLAKPQPATNEVRSNVG